MDKTKVLAAVNIVLFISVFLQAASGMAIVLIGSSFAHQMHKLNGAFFLIVLIVHLALNWGWVTAVVLKRTSAAHRRKNSQSGG